MDREPLVEAAMNKMTLTMMAAFSEEQITRVLVGYLTSCELYMRDTGDGQGKLPLGLQAFHNEAKALLGLSNAIGNGERSKEFPS